ncbi:MAG TPA: hypothetical protein VMB79_17150 [Jatrophihabitans sp.]|nr:hypothetical protein [Jatrophihabitans sp.]
MLTNAAGRAAATRSNQGSRRLVYSPSELAARGVTRSRLTANLAADRWQRVGAAVVLHTGPLSRDERWRAALVNCGPRSLLTSFTAAEVLGVAGWNRTEIHVLAPAGASISRRCQLPIVLHRSRRWPVPVAGRRRCHRLADALLMAAGSFTSPRPGCGLLAAAVQQRRTDVSVLRAALEPAGNLRHRQALLQASEDIAGGSQALSEIDFIRLCRVHRLPPPEQQRVRRDSAGRRRYLDASWRRADGRPVVVEVDGALHLEVRRWWDDQMRQNELILADAIVLRFPSVTVRTRPGEVIAQLRRALHTGRPS